MSGANDHRVAERTVAASQVIDMRDHDDPVLDGNADQGDKSYRRGDIQGHAPDIQRQHAAK